MWRCIARKQELTWQSAVYIIAPDPLRARPNYGEDQSSPSPALLTRGNVSLPLAERVILSLYTQLHIYPNAAIEFLRTGFNAQVRSG